jgi:hypothetical protein
MNPCRGGFGQPEHPLSSSNLESASLGLHLCV